METVTIAIVVDQDELAFSERTPALGSTVAGHVPEQLRFRDLPEMPPERQRPDEVATRAGWIEVLAPLGQMGVTGNHANQRSVGAKGFDDPVQSRLERIAECLLERPYRFDRRFEGTRLLGEPFAQEEQPSRSKIGLRFYFFLAGRSQRK